MLVILYPPKHSTSKTQIITPASGETEPGRSPGLTGQPAWPHQGAPGKRTDPVSNSMDAPEKWHLSLTSAPNIHHTHTHTPAHLTLDITLHTQHILKQIKAKLVHFHFRALKTKSQFGRHQQFRNKHKQTPCWWLVCFFTPFAGSTKRNSESEITWLNIYSVTQAEMVLRKRSNC